VLATAVTRTQSNPILLAITALLILGAWSRQLLSWPALLGYVVVVVLFVPIRRYTVAAGLPVQLEPYRVLIGLVLGCWLLALLVDPRTRFKSMGLEAPVLILCAAIMISLGLNVHRITSFGISGDVAKQLSFMAGFLLVMYFGCSIVDSARTLDHLLMVVVGGGTIVGLFSIVEWQTGVNVFNQLQRVVPVLHLNPELIGEPLSRGHRVRAFASAQHPIALGALLVMLMPLALYLHRRSGRLVWLAATGILTLGALATGSRTVAIMLVALLLTFLWLKRAETIRLLPMLLPMIVVAQIVMPGTLGTFKAVLFPENGSLIAEQKGGAGNGTGRVQDLGPSLHEASRTPLFGQGYGTRLTSPDDKIVNAIILDDEWLSTLLEIGAIGTLALLWLYVRCVRMLARRAKTDDSPYGWLLTALAASITAFALGMITYDAFSFIQVTVLSFLLIGFAAAALRVGPGPARAPSLRAS
jgi:hypothetical protein